MAPTTPDIDSNQDKDSAGGIPRIRGSGLVRVYTKIKSIGDLPDDVLTEIFLILYAYWPSRQHKRRSELGACRRWYNVMINMPLLWRSVHLPRGDAADGEPQRRLISMHLTRSRNALLDVRFVPTRNLEERDCSLVFQNALRIRKLEAQFITRGAFHNIFSQDWERLEMPNLQSLIVSDGPRGYFQDESTNSLPLSIRPWQGMEALHKLELNNFPFTDFPAGTRVRSLSLKSARVSSFILKEIFQHFPCLETLSIRDFISPSLDGGVHLGRPIRAPNLRNLAIGGIFLHEAECNCGLALLVAPNIETVEYHGMRRSLLNDAHTTILFKSGGEKTRRLRVCNQQRSKEKELFLYSRLPSHIDLEFAELPGDDACFIIELLSSLSNLHSITLALYPPVDNILHRKARYQANNLNPTNFSQIVRQFKPVLACPTYIRVFDTSLIPEDVRHILGHNLTILVSPMVKEDWVADCDHIRYPNHDWDQFDKYLRNLYLQGIVSSISEDEYSDEND
ncbi:hypothetical protein D9619_003475 [Psilocybe cf. subviscida]|uniref:F-box domain-containing protein n=1 Tax=Psilocybe cf. subviscida TaxID=2480587 RepID=A0A8H5AWC0_9AGAR|nr:hypothetical protein D9619_003475 [Psilocybe cf. subviscida]